MRWGLYDKFKPSIRFSASLSGLILPESISTKVVFPVPFGPSIPIISPFFRLPEAVLSEKPSKLFVKEGYAYIVPPKELERIGSTEVTFQMPGVEEGRFFRLLNDENGYELRLYTDQSLFCGVLGQLSVIRFLKTA